MLDWHPPWRQGAEDPAEVGSERAVVTKAAARATEADPSTSALAWYITQTRDISVCVLE